MRVTHIFGVDFDLLKENDLYSSLCGKRYMACEPPTAEESLAISAKTKDDPVCKRCLKEKQKTERQQELVRLVASSPEVLQKLGKAVGEDLEKAIFADRMLPLKDLSHSDLRKSSGERD